MYKSFNRLSDIVLCAVVFISFILLNVLSRVVGEAGIPSRNNSLFGTAKIAFQKNERRFSKKKSVQTKFERLPEWNGPERILPFLERFLFSKTVNLSD